MTDIAFLGCPRGVEADVLDYNMVVCEFELQARHYVNFRANIVGKGMKPRIPSAMR